MNNFNIKDIFDDRHGKAPSNSRTYDVRITLNKNGGERFAIRFGFLNNAIKALNGKAYAQVSNVEKLKTRIYFRTFDHKANLDAHKLSTNSHSRASNLYMTITPTAGAEKIYRSMWIGKEFSIKYDAYNELYYIELAEAVTGNESKA